MTASSARPLSRKNSTFYKKIEPIAEETEENPPPTTQKKFNKRSLSQSNFHLAKEKKEVTKEPNNKSIEKNLDASTVSKNI